MKSAAYAPIAPRITGRVPHRSAAQPAGYRIAALASSPAAKTTPTSAEDPPRRVMKIGSSGRKNQRPIAVSRVPADSVHSLRRVIRNTVAGGDDQAGARTATGPPPVVPPPGSPAHRP